MATDGGDDLDAQDDATRIGELIELPGVKHIPPINKGNAAEMARKKAQKESDKRAEAQIRRKIKARAVLGDDPVDDAAVAVENRSLLAKSVEDLADLQTKRMLAVMIGGGEAFLPSTARECAELANMCSQISSREAAKRRALSVPEDDESDVQKEAVRAVRQLKSRLKQANG